MSDALSLFTEEEAGVSPFNGYPLGSYWKIKYDRGDGENHTVSGVIYEHRMWSNQWRLDQYQEYVDKGVDVPQWFRDEELQEEPQLVLYTGYSFGENHFGSRIWISNIKKAQRLHGLSIRLLHQEWQAQHDRWARNDEKHAEWWAHPGTIHVGWSPEPWTGPCDHKIWTMRHDTKAYVVHCVCGEELDRGPYPEDPCLWWMYVGPMGRDRVYQPHDADDCTWCSMKRRQDDE